VAESHLLCTVEGTKVRGVSIGPGGVDGKVALLGMDLVYQVGHQFAEAHKGVRIETKGESIVGRRRGCRAGVVFHEGVSSLVESRIGGGYD